jgi:hypothetical protein
MVRRAVGPARPETDIEVLAAVADGSRVARTAARPDVLVATSRSGPAGLELAQPVQRQAPIRW